MARKPAKHTVAVDRILDGFKIDAYLANKEGGSLMADELELAHKKAKAELGKLFMDMVGEDEPDGYDRLLGTVEDIEGKTFNLIELTSSEPESTRNQLRAKLRQRIKAIFGKVD